MAGKRGPSVAALARLVIFGFIALTIVYVGLSVWSRRRHRARLEREWDRQDHPGNRDAYIAEGMAQYEGSLRRRLIVLVYVIPVCTVALLVYLTNFS